MQSPITAIAKALRGPSPIERLRAAEEKLKLARQNAGRDQLQHIANLGEAVALDPAHPSHDFAATVIAEAEAELAAAQTAVAADDREAQALRDSMRTALQSVISKLEGVVDPDEPTIDSTPEAKALFQDDLDLHARNCKSNAEQRERIEQACVAQLRSAKSVDDASAMIAHAQEKLASVVDPAAPLLGRCCPSNVEALEHALIAHREALASNMQKRADAHRDFRAIARAITASLSGLQTRRKAEGLPVPRIFMTQTIKGHSVSIDRLQVADLANYRLHLEGLGAAPIEAHIATRKLREIKARRKRWETAKAEAHDAERGGHSASGSGRRSRGS